MTTRLFTILTLLLFATPLLQAQSIQVKILGPDAAYTTHDMTTIALDLDAMLKATSGRSGSAASATVLSGQSLIEAYYHPSYRNATRAVTDTKYDYLVILPETGFLSKFPEGAFDGVLQMSRRALNVGSTPLLLMPRGGSLAIATVGENSYRIGNGSGIEVVPGGYAVEAVSGLSNPATTRNTRRQSYLMAASLYTKITGLNPATSTTYVPLDGGGLALDVSTLANAAVSANNTHATTPHYSTSRHNSGAIRFRTTTPPNNTVRYLYGGTSTEAGISGALNAVITASGHLVSTNKRPSSEGQVWNSTVFNNSKAAFDADPNEYLFTYWRGTDTQAQAVIDYNQANLLPFFYDRHFDDVNGGSGSTNQLLDDIQQRCDSLRFNYEFYGWMSIPLHLGVARLKDVDASIIYSNDGTHMTDEHYYMMASMIFTSALGRDPTPPAGILTNTKSINGFNLGKQTIKELAFLSETMAFTPESSLAIDSPAPLVKARWETFSQTFTATGGIPPYTWSESSVSGLPAGLSLSPAGVLSGAVTSSPKVWQLVIKATDSLGAIHKVPFSLNVTSGVGSLAISQTTSYTAVIAPGGAAPSATATYTVQNPGLTSINWTASKTQPWLTVSPTSGILATGASVNVTVSMNSGVSSLAIGTHPDLISFTNITNGFGNTTRGVSLRVNAPPILNAVADRTVTFNPAPWTPAAINSVAWYDATDTSTIVHLAGSVSEWKSKKGTIPMVQVDTSKQPTTGTFQINGLNTIAFDGTGDALKTATNPFGSSIQNGMFMGVVNIGTIANSTLFSLSGTAADAARRFQAHAPFSDENIYFDCAGTTGANRLQIASNWTANQNKLVGFYNSTADNVQQIWDSGILIKGDASGHAVNTDSGVALGHNGVDDYDHCRMGEVVILNGAVSSGNRQVLEGYLAHKWGFITALPSNHPYKASPLGAGTFVSLSGITSSDTDNDPLTYAWTVVGSSTGVVILDAMSQNSSLFFTALGSYTLRLTVSDGYSQASDDVRFDVVQNHPPVVETILNQAVAMTNWLPVALNPVGWYDATDALTISQSGGAVSEWRSKVGSSHMLQAASGKRPTTGTKQINGRNVLAFDGIDDALKTATNPFGSTIQNALFMTVTNIGENTASTLFSLSGSSVNPAQRFQAHAPFSDGKVYFDVGGTTGANRLQSTATWSANQTKLLGFYSSVAASVQQVWDSGTVILGDAGGHTLNTESGISLGHDGASAYDNCTMGEVVIVNGVVTADNRQRLESYLAHKWGLASTLPVTHPYRSAPSNFATVNLTATAGDTNNDPLTYNWSVVSGPADYVIYDANSINARFVSNVPGIYTLRLTVSDGVLQSTEDFIIQAGNLTPYQTWANGSFVRPFTLTGALEDPDGDGNKNLLEFAFGTDPTRSTGPLGFSPGGELASPGLPVLEVTGSPATYHAIFCRRKNHATAGISYSTLFSADMKTWTVSSAGLNVISNPASSADVEVVRVPFPNSVPLETGGSAPPAFFRVSVNMN
ncbi:MAG: PKD domain-containing protein [Luteolibacter sp.]